MRRVSKGGGRVSKLFLMNYLFVLIFFSIFSYMMFYVTRDAHGGNHICLARGYVSYKDTEIHFFLNQI